jgi:hypothetical protein
MAEEGMRGVRCINKEGERKSKRREGRNGWVSVGSVTERLLVQIPEPTRFK